MARASRKFSRDFLKWVLDKPKEGHYTPLHTAATRSWTGD
ncbi:hypothetical protein SJ05684_c20620 [Sinorhizobium sojae CCBAU 05684]|uniref:Uncharacterized protein n=1 Tax=Sinorhizobium sojae CCBAU 05684 TaxID=716928 RepID=A0A249PCW1_9HYPH|nr:hypothetical protein SJ05684_c20620 [Sinorhizobium sojae CCBAU 05684]